MKTWKSLGKYVIASAAIAVILIIIPHPQRLLATLAITFLGGTTYILTLLTIDRDTRN